MKSISRILLSTLIISATYAIGWTVPNTHAYTVEDNGTVWWTPAELLEYKATIDQEEFNQCGQDINCIQEFYERKADESWTNPKYRALESFRSLRLALTEVNPTTDAIKVVFLGDDMMLKHMGILEDSELELIYTGWPDEVIDADPIYNFRRNGNGARFMNQTMPGMHPVYLWQQGDGSSKIIPDQEIELASMSPNLASNHTGFIAFAYIAGTSDAFGRLYYDTCFEDPTYSEGNGCRLVISSNGEQRYLPFDTTTIVEETSEPTPSEQPNQEDTSSVPVSIPQPTTSPEKVTKYIYATVKDSNPPTTQAPTVSNAGNSTLVSQADSGATNTTNSDDKEGAITTATDHVELPLAAISNTESTEEHSFPWHLILLAFFGAVFFIFSWWFLLPLFKRRDDE